MRLNLRSLGLAVALLAAVPALAADSDQTEKEKTDRILREIQGLKLGLEDLRTMALQVQSTAKDVRELQRRVEGIEQHLDRISARTRVSASFTPTEPAATATIRLQNRYSVPATVLINGQPYAVPAYETRLVAGVPVGGFTYEVRAEGFGTIQPAVSRTVNPNETFTIFINPPSTTELLLAP